MPRRGPHNPDVTWMPHLRVSWGGVLGTPGVEIFSNTVNFMAVESTVPTAAELDAMTVALAAVLSAYHALADSKINNQAFLTYVKANWILATGLQRDSSTHVFDISPPVAGAQSAACPWYETYALTLRTNVSRGRAHSGRIFPPMVSFPNFQASNGLADDFSLGPYAQAFAHCLFGMKSAIATATAAADTWNPVVVSPGKTSTGKAAIFSIIQSVVVDAVPDVQHRRTHKLKRHESAAFPLV